MYKFLIKQLHFTEINIRYLPYLERKRDIRTLFYKFSAVESKDVSVPLEFALQFDFAPSFEALIF